MSKREVLHKGLSGGLVRDVIVLVLLGCGAAAVPLSAPSNYVLGQLALLFLWTCVVIQWNLVFGVAGIMSLANVAMFAAGAYGTAMVATYANVPFWLSFLTSAPAAVLFGLALGTLTLRMRGDHVAIVTLAVTILMATLIVNDVSCFREVDSVCYPLTGGSRGLSGYGDFGWAKILGFKFRALGDYYLTLALALLSMLIALFVIHGPFGLAFRAIRDNETYARARGVSFRRIQLLVFALSGIMTGLAGGAYAGFVKTVGPTLLSLDLMVFLLSMIIIGGRGSTWGPVLGAAVLMWADSQFQALGAWRTGALALITISCIVVYPRGLVGLGAQITRLPVFNKPQAAAPAERRPT